MTSVRWRTAVWLALCLIGQAAAAAPPAETLNFTGRAYDLKSNQLLYTEVHQVVVGPEGPLSDATRYLDAHGQEIARKSVDYRADPFVPLFRLDAPGQNYTESIVESGSHVVMLRRMAGAERRKQIVKSRPLAADAGLLNFIDANFDTLLARTALKLRIVVAARLNTFTVRLRRIDDLTVEGRTLLRFQVEHHSPLRLLLNPLILTYDPETRRLLEYRGQSNIRNPKTGDPYEVRISFSEDR